MIGNKVGTTVIRLVFLVLFAFILAKGKMMIWLGFFAAGLLATLLFGRLYCGYVCPMNTLMIPVEWLSKRLKMQTDAKPVWLKNGYFQWVALFSSLMAMVVLKKILHINFPILILWLLISVLVTFRYKPAIFHNLICPYGGLLKTFGKIARGSKKVDISSCTGCGLCEPVCPAHAISLKGDDKANINSSTCHQCSNCSSVCPVDAIKRGKL